MKIFLTGSTGRVGRRLLPRLAAGGHEVSALVRDPATVDAITAVGAKAVTGDLLDPSTYEHALAGHDAVLHVGAVLRSQDETLIKRVNLDSTVSLARAAATAGVPRLVFTSTNLVYPQTKAQAERTLLDLAGLDVRIVRLAFVYGDGDPHLRESLHWAAQWPAHQRLHMIHHADVAQALVRALNAPGIDGRIYNAADESPVTAWELHQINGQAMPDNGASDGDMWHGIVDTARIRTELGFRALYPSMWSAHAAGAL